MNAQDAVPAFRSRRRLLKNLTLAGAAGIAGFEPGFAGAEPPPETTRLRLPQISTVFNAPIYVAEDSMRYYALRLQEAGYIKSSAMKLVVEGTDWRFLDELKKELKA